MIVDTMSIKEIAVEVARDVRLMEYKFLKYIPENKYRRYMIKHKPNGPTYWTLYWQSPRNNNYTILLNSPNWQDYKHNGLCYVPYLVFEWKYGKAAAMRCNDKSIAIYTPHFFKRYNERLLHSTQNNTEQTIEHFFTNNSTQQTKANSNFEIYGVCKDGYLLGTIEDGARLFKTFVSFDMLHADQTQDADTLQNALRTFLKQEYGTQQQ